MAGCSEKSACEKEGEEGWVVMIQMKRVNLSLGNCTYWLRCNICKKSMYAESCHIPLIKMKLGVHIAPGFAS